MDVLKAQIRPFLVDLLRKEEVQSLASHAVCLMGVKRRPRYHGIIFYLFEPLFSTQNQMAVINILKTVNLLGIFEKIDSFSITVSF